MPPQKHAANYVHAPLPVPGGHTRCRRPCSCRPAPPTAAPGLLWGRWELARAPPASPPRHQTRQPQATAQARLLACRLLAGWRLASPDPPLAGRQQGWELPWRLALPGCWCFRCLLCRPHLAAHCLLHLQRCLKRRPSLARRLPLPLPRPLRLHRSSLPHPSPLVLMHCQQPGLAGLQLWRCWQQHLPSHYC